MKKPLFTAISKFWLIFLFPVIIGISIPKEAQASLFSLITKTFDKKDVQVASPTNSQTMTLLKAVLNGDPDYAKGGGDITIVGNSALLSETGPAGTSADISGQNINGEISIYVVRPGDSLSQIAKMFGVSTNTIIWANDIQRGLITPGQTLVILPISGVQHAVKKGDTIKSLAAKYNADAEEIISFNNLPENGALEVGVEITIPDGVLEAPVKTSSGSRIVKLPGLPTYSGYYLRPVTGARKTQGIHGYNGVDLGAPTGTEVMASAGGQVIISKSSGWNGGYGNYIVIKHQNGTQTLYSHTSKNLVSVGEYVNQGQAIALVGSTGKSTGPHLHFEVRGAINPF